VSIFLFCDLSSCFFFFIWCSDPREREKKEESNKKANERPEIECAVVNLSVEDLQERYSSE